ncbi:MAG: Tol-Pal system protein TolB [Pseudomonadales bacterium]|nr:Tol-Pal system protein TolB [Pseudomonadales bacterium]
MTSLLRKVMACGCLLTTFVGMNAFADLTIEITQGQDNPVSIAIVPFEWTGHGTMPEDLSAIASEDLFRSGQFEPMSRSNMLSFPHYKKEVHFRDWRLLGAEYLLIGHVDYDELEKLYSAHYVLYNVPSGRQVVAGMFSSNALNLRDIGHAISDRVYEKITGITGNFSTRILYVTEHLIEVNGSSFKEYRLEVADADGYRVQNLLKSSEPILSPDWSEDGQRIAYVSFESERPAIYTQELKTGKRTLLTSYTGLNGAPDWSPDGTQIALVLSKDGNPEIYTIDIATKKLARVTNHFGIDTEPRWMPDGQSLIFTSNRGGKPQIYKVILATGFVERLTFEGDYNARGQVTPNGRYLVMVHRNNGVFHIAVQDLKRGIVRTLTETDLDESPSISPNGTMVVYATKVAGRGILAAVSVDGSVKMQLPSSRGDVREPAWSPVIRP